MAKKVIKALELGKMHKSQLDLSKEIIQAKDKLIENQKNIIDTQIQQKANYELAVEEQQKTIVLQTTIIDSKDKVIKKEKGKTNLWKIISLGVASLLGTTFVFK